MIRSQLPQFKAMSVTPDITEIYDWGLIDLNIPQIHKQTMGEGIKIGIIDTGKSDHFEVQNNIAATANFTASNRLNDLNGHSTFISGIIAAQKNDKGIVGVAPKAKLYFAKAIEDSGGGNPTALIQAIDWCIKQKVDIVSISAGIFYNFMPLHKIIKKAHDRNIIIVAAIGNSGTSHFDVAFPARYREVIGVGAYDKDRHVAKFSSRGLNVSFALPGVDIYSTWLDNTYAKLSGTSFACPIMAGVCALILSKHRTTDSSTPCTNTQEMIEHLEKYSINLGDKNAAGFGTINLESLIKED